MVCKGMEDHTCCFHLQHDGEFRLRNEAVVYGTLRVNKSIDVPIKSSITIRIAAALLIAGEAEVWTSTGLGGLGTAIAFCETVLRLFATRLLWATMVPLTAAVTVVRTTLRIGWTAPIL